MNNFFNPFHDFNNEKQNKEEKEKNIKEKNIKTTYQQKKINQLKPYNKSIAHKYLSNNNLNNPNILNIIKTSNLSDEYSIKIIKYLYKNMKDNKNKQELIKILSDKI